MTNLAYKTSPDPPVDKSPGSVVDLVRIPQITLHAFCDAPETIAVMERVVADRRMSRAHATVYPGGVAAAIELYQKATSPNLVVIESRAAVDDLHAGLDALANVCGSGTKLVVIGHANDIVLYRELLARGVDEYVVAPIDTIAMIAVISRLYRNAGAKKLGRSVAFIGANGGVGSSTIARNVASTMARAYSSDVILADLDLPFGAANLGFKLNAAQGIAQALQDASRLDDVLLDRLLTKCEEHLSLLTAPGTLDHCYDLEEGAFDRVLDIAQSNVPFVVLDVPHVWTSWAKKTLLTADMVVITAEPDLAGLRNAKNLIDLLKQARPNDEPPKLVLNQVGVPKRSEIEPGKFAAALQIEPIVCIPFEPLTLSTAANDGQMIADASPKSAVAKGFSEIARVISGRTAVNNSRKGRFAFRRPWRSGGHA
jgi:pilus assembly protein CpaE